MAAHCPLVPASDPVSSSRIGCEAIGGAASAVFPNSRCSPCAKHMALRLCSKPTPFPLLQAEGRWRTRWGLNRKQEASSPQVLVGRGRSSEGAVLRICPPARIYIQVHPGDHSCLVTKTERVWGRHLAHSMPPQPCPGSEPESPLCTQEWMDSGP